ncbi:MAG: sodium/solute symporter [Candidatus Latescibacteria bacterium]|jgi:solute:Na+ symporter, SSS family|nr:sodium/solute symporter [Candidatus Latescibacterota bacterium]
MDINLYDYIILFAYFIVLLSVGFIKGKGKRASSEEYFISKGTLPWWVIAAAFVTTGMNTEQLIGQNGMGYTIGLTMVNWYIIALFVYTALIFVFLPIYMRNGIVTMPEFLGRRYNAACRNVFSVLLIVSYVLLNLAVVFYGGAKLLEVVMGLNIWYGVILLGVVAGIYTMYGGMASASYAAVFQFALIFISGFVIFFLGYIRLPNGWSDVVANAPGGFHLMQPMDYPVIPWHAIPLTMLGLHLYYSCVNQALVQRSFGAKTEWDARMAIIVSGFFVLLRPFVEILPGMICRALGTFDPRFNLDNQPIDNVFPLLIRELIPAGFRGLILVGILSSVMSTISAFLNSISTLFTLDVYKKWINKDAGEKELVRIGTIVTLFLMFFSVLYSPFVGIIGGGIFNYFQMLASYLAVPIATVFLVGILWKRATPASALTIMISGIPLGIFISWLMPRVFAESTVNRFSLDNFFVSSGISQAVCVAIMVMVSFFTTPKPIEEISSLLFSKEKVFLPKNEPKRPVLQSIWFWWCIFAAVYVLLYIKLW